VGGGGARPPARPRTWPARRKLYDVRCASWLVGLARPRRKLLLASRLGSRSAVRSRESHPTRPRCEGHLSPSHGPAAPLRPFSSPRSRARDASPSPRFVHPRLSTARWAIPSVAAHRPVTPTESPGAYSRVALARSPRLSCRHSQDWRVERVTIIPPAGAPPGLSERLQGRGGDSWTVLSVQDQRRS
jgi:hypothetical protein